MSRGWLEAGSLALRAIDIVRHATAATDQVVMIIADAQFIKGGASGWLDSPDQSGLKQDTQVIVDRLSGKAAEALAREESNRIGRLMRTGSAEDLEHGEAGRGDAQRSLAERCAELDGSRHSLDLAA